MFKSEIRKIDQKLNLTNSTVAKVPFDLAHWQQVALEKYPDGLPEPESDDPTQWLFHGRPEASTCPLQVAVSRLLGYRWPTEFSVSGQALAAGAVDRRDGVDSANQEPAAKEPDANALRLMEGQEPDANALRLSARARALVESCDALSRFADTDGIVCIPPVRGESGAADRLLNLLAAAYGNNQSSNQPQGVSPRFQAHSDAAEPDADACRFTADNTEPDANASRVTSQTAEPDANALRVMERVMGTGWSNDVLSRLLADADYAGKSLETWLRDGFFQQHCELFHQRPFIWHVWDGLRDGFAALVNCHKLDRKNLETLIYTYLGDWITRCESHDKDVGLTDDGEKTTAAKNLKRKLEQILEGEAPYDIFVRWKPLHQQAIGWEPDLNDGVRMNIRPFLSVPDVKAKGADILRVKPKIKWEKDRGKEPQRSKEDFPWFWGWDGKTTDFAGVGSEPTCERFNECHYTLARKRKARERQL